MVQLADDFRFASSSSASISQRYEEEIDDPIFGSGEPTGSNGHSWRSRFENGKSIFDDEQDDDRHPRASTSKLVEPEPAENSELYAVLNVEKDCSQEDILKSYRSLAVAFQYAMAIQRQYACAEAVVAQSRQTPEPKPESCSPDSFREDTACIRRYASRRAVQ